MTDLPYDREKEMAFVGRCVVDGGVSGELVVVRCPGCSMLCARWGRGRAGDECVGGRVVVHAGGVGAGGLCTWGGSCCGS